MNIYMIYVVTNMAQTRFWLINESILKLFLDIVVVAGGGGGDNTATLVARCIDTKIILYVCIYIK